MIKSMQIIKKKYKDRFVTDYAATNPGEDIAEVFATFVTQADQPRGNSIADQKIKLLYDFPELTQLRDKIRQNANPATLFEFLDFKISFPKQPLQNQSRFRGCDVHKIRLLSGNILPHRLKAKVTC